MSDQTPYEALRASVGRSRFPKEVAAARRTERTRRHAVAQRRARFVLISRHRAEYDKLYATEKAAIEIQRGPLPGDNTDGSEQSERKD